MQQVFRNLGWCRSFTTRSSPQRFNSAVEDSFPKKNIWKIRRERFLSNILGLVQQGKVEEADTVFTSMISKHKIKPNTVLYNALLKGYAELGDTKSAFRLFNNLKKHGLKPSDHTYSTMFRACSRAGQAGKDILTKVSDEIERRDVVLNTRSFNSQLSALIHCSEDIDKVFEMFNDGSSEIPESSIETLGTLLLAASKDYTNGMGRCVAIWEELVKRFVANLHCYNTLLHCIRTSGVPDHMLQPPASTLATRECKLTPANEVSLHLSSSNQVPLNIIVYISRTHVRWLEKESLDSLLSAMKSDNVIPDIRTLSILSSLLPDFAEIERLSRKFDVQLDDRISKSNQIRKTLENSNAVDKGRIKATSDHFTQERRLSLLEEVKDCTDPAKWRKVLKVYARLRDYSSLIIILKRMKYNEVYISNELLLTLDCIAEDQPKNPRLQNSYNGFKGYYRLWCKSIGMGKDN